MLRMARVGAAPSDQGYRGKYQSTEHLSDYHFSFENLAFEGGGIKMIAHIGVIQVRRFEFYVA